MARKGQNGKRQGQAAEPSPALTSAEGAAVQDPAPPEPILAVVVDDGAGRYPVLSPLRFNGRRYRPDDPDANEVVMPRGQAEALQAINVLGEELT